MQALMAVTSLTGCTVSKKDFAELMDTNDDVSVELNIAVLNTNGKVQTKVFASDMGINQLKNAESTSAASDFKVAVLGTNGIGKTLMQALASQNDSTPGVNGFFKTGQIDINDKGIHPEQGNSSDLNAKAENVLELVNPGRFDKDRAGQGDEKAAILAQIVYQAMPIQTVTGEGSKESVDVQMSTLQILRQIDCQLFGDFYVAKFTDDATVEVLNNRLKTAGVDGTITVDDLKDIRDSYVKSVNTWQDKSNVKAFASQLSDAQVFNELACNSKYLDYGGQIDPIFARVKYVAEGNDIANYDAENDGMMDTIYAQPASNFEVAVYMYNMLTDNGLWTNNAETNADTNIGSIEVKEDADVESWLQDTDHVGVPESCKSGKLNTATTIKEYQTYAAAETKMMQITQSDEYKSIMSGKQQAMLLDNIDNSKLFDDVETRTMISMMRNIASNIDLEKASSIAEGVGLPDINSLGKDDGETENVQVFDFDLYIDQFKEENNIEINPDDIGTDISDIDSLHDWLYNNGVTRESVQNDRDSGCKNPYLDGYLEYLDNLDKPSETPSNTKIDFSKADAVHDSSEFGGNAGGKVYEINGHYYLEDGLELAKDADGNWAVLVPDLGVADSITKEEIDASTQKAVDYLESGQALKDLDAYYAKHPDQQH